MKLSIMKNVNNEKKTYIEDELYKYNLAHFPKDLRGRYEQIHLFIEDEYGNVRGGLLGEVCWNWLEVNYLIVDEDIRHLGYGTKLLLEIEKIAYEKKCDFIKVETLSFQALEFYEKHNFIVYGKLNNVGRDFEHYFLKKVLIN
ncbi:GNAT family N-acetyltransferase [Alkalicoccobacillus plakortidis]|uniref:GNAT family N-acetyltransferase n=1 Tax=Alkalicoccobacillus plakortidis TaxID=444060 RepID=A0ABT0XG95_9BACI|nr:GNAT family N-acetyltransferase [Alkalicoccobacillus plakortidis]MCM2674931.1 GNAT family N-acetyltransferase [Alkalicoccobacillus plakortidis]